MAPSSAAVVVSFARILCAMEACTGAWGMCVALAFFDVHALLSTVDADGMRMLEDDSFDRRMRSSIASTSCEGICEEGSWAFHGAAARRPPCARPPPRSPGYGAKAVEFSLQQRQGKEKRKIPHPNRFSSDEWLIYDHCISCSVNSHCTRSVSVGDQGAQPEAPDLARLLRHARGRGTRLRRRAALPQGL